MARRCGIAELAVGTEVVQYSNSDGSYLVEARSLVLFLSSIEASVHQYMSPILAQHLGNSRAIRYKMI